MISEKIISAIYPQSDYNSKMTMHSWINMVSTYSLHFTLDQKAKVMKFIEAWTDSRLKWNKDEYDNIDRVTVHGEDLWQPDFSTYHA